MNKGKLLTYALSLSLLVILLSCFIFIKQDNAVWVAIILAIFALLISWLVKGRSTLSIYKGQVLLILSVTSLLFVMIYYLTGLYFGFYRSVINTLNGMLKKALPIIVVVVATEFIRKALVSQKYKFMVVITFLCCIVAEMALTHNLKAFTNFNRFMDFVGLYLFPALVCNILYFYVIVRYGVLPNIVYRLITLLLPIFIPYTPAISDALFAFLKLVFPILIYFFISILYEKKKREKKHVSKKVGALILALIFLFGTSTLMLVSCQFHYCALVIATESMTGELNKGDVIVYEKYAENDVIKEGQVIVFEKYGAITVHRVKEIEHYNGQTRYYTKGDANQDVDSGYITDSDIYGFVHFKIPYAGFPTLWLRAIFK